jgi:hypothetical protein
MNVDKALANFRLTMSLGSGDTGRGRVEHRSILQLSVLIIKCKIQVI